MHELVQARSSNWVPQSPHPPPVCCWKELGEHSPEFTQPMGTQFPRSIPRTFASTRLDRSSGKPLPIWFPSRRRRTLPGRSRSRTRSIRNFLCNFGFGTHRTRTLGYPRPRESRRPAPTAGPGAKFTGIEQVRLWLPQSPQACVSTVPGAQVPWSPHEDHAPNSHCWEQVRVCTPQFPHACCSCTPGLQTLPRRTRTRH